MGNLRLPVTTGAPVIEPRREGFDSYTELLRAAEAGRGLALGWRHYVEPYLAAGALVAVCDEWVEFSGRLSAALTPHGRKNLLARRCQRYFGSLP